MKWESERRSDNVEDRRGVSLRGGAIGGGAVVLAIVAALLGAPQSLVRALLGVGGAGDATETADPRARSPEENRLADFVSVVLASTEDTWSDLFSASGRRYAPPRLVLFTDMVRSACGTNSAAVGPFYCPPDRRVYLDLGFFGELDRRFGAPGDFAQAYVVAHEVGHHVQNLLGISARAESQRARSGSEAAANRISVEIELQADCLAGVWGHHANRTRQLLEPGDVEEGLRAAAAIGDDTLQRAARGRAVPETFTHGTSEQRVHWLRRGLTGGRIDDCDTFAGRL